MKFLVELAMELSMSKGSLCDQLWQTVHTIIIVSKTLKVVPLTCSRRTPGIVVFVLLACRECTLITLSFYFQQKLSIAIKINNDLMKITRGFFFCVTSPGPKSIICFEKKQRKFEKGTKVKSHLTINFCNCRGEALKNNIRRYLFCHPFAMAKTAHLIM